MSLAPETAPERLEGADARVLALVAVLGLNAWASVSALPAWHLVADGSLTAGAAALAAIAPVPLVVGLLLLRRRDRRAHLSLVLAFPFALLLPAMAQPSMVRAGVLSAPATIFASLGLAGFLLASCWAVGREETSLVASRSAPTSRSRPGGGARVYHVALPATAALVAAVVIGVGHLLAGARGGAMSDGSREVVASAFALALWVVTMLLVFVPAARRPRLGMLPRASRGAAVVWLLVLVIAAAMVLASSE